MSSSRIRKDLVDPDEHEDLWAESCDSPGPPGAPVAARKTALLGVENARRRLKAFSIQKKQTSVVSTTQSPSSLTATTGSTLVTGGKTGQPKKTSTDKADKKTSKKDKKESTYKYMVNKLNEMKASDDIKKRKYEESIKSILKMVGLPSTDEIRPLKIFEMEMLFNRPYDPETIKLIEDLKLEYQRSQCARERTTSQTSLQETNMQDMVVCDSWSLEDEQSKEKSQQKTNKNKSTTKQNTGLSMISELYSPELSSNSNSPEIAPDSSANASKDADMNHFFISESVSQKKKELLSSSDVEKEKKVPSVQIPEPILQPTMPTFHVDKFGFLIRNTAVPLIPTVDDSSKDKSRRKDSDSRKDSKSRRSDRRDHRESRSDRHTKDRRDERDRRHSSKDRDDRSRHRKDDERRSHRDGDSRSKRHLELKERKEERSSKSKRSSAERERSGSVKDADNKNNDNSKTEKNTVDNRSVDSSETFEAISRTKIIEQISNSELESLSKHSDSNSKFSNSSRLPDEKNVVPSLKDSSVTSRESVTVDTANNRDKLASEWENSQSPDYVMKLDTQWERSPTPDYKRNDDFSSRRDFCPENIIIKDVWEDLNDSLEKHAMTAGDSCSIERPEEKMDFIVKDDLAVDSLKDKGDEIEDERVDYWKDVTEACGPYHHISEKCYRKTIYDPVISYCENVKRCGCRALLSDKFDKLSCNADKIKQGLSPTQDQQSMKQETSSAERVWYPDENHALNDKPATIELESNWEKDDDDTPERDELTKFNRHHRRLSVVREDKEIKDHVLKSVNKKEMDIQLNEKERNYKLRPTIVPDQLLTSKNVVIDVAKDFIRSSFIKGSLLDISIIPTPVIDPPLPPVNKDTPDKKEMPVKKEAPNRKETPAKKETPIGPPSLDLEYEKFMEAVGTEISTDKPDENQILETQENSKSFHDKSTPKKSSKNFMKSDKKYQEDDIKKSTSNKDIPAKSLTEKQEATEECLDVSDIMKDVSKKRKVKDKEGKRAEKLSEKKPKKKDKMSDGSEKSDSKKLKKTKLNAKKKRDALAKKRKEKKKIKKRKKTSSSSSNDSSSSSSSSESSSDSSSSSSSSSDSSSSSSDSSDESKSDKRRKKKLRVKKKTLKVSPKSKKKFKKPSGKTKNKSLTKKSKDGKKLNKNNDKKKRNKEGGAKGVKAKMGRKLKESGGEEKLKTKVKEDDVAYSSDEEEMQKVLLAEKLRKAKKLNKKMSKKKQHDTKKHGKDKKEKEKDNKKRGKKRRKNDSTSTTTSDSSSSSDSDSSEDERESRKQKKKNKRKMEQVKDVPIKRRKTDEMDDDDDNNFDMTTLLNIKQEKVSDDEEITKSNMEGQFSPRIQRNVVHEIISINELHNDFVQSNKKTFENVVIKTEKIDEGECVNENVSSESNSLLDLKRGDRNVVKMNSESNSGDSKRSERSLEKVNSNNNSVDFKQSDRSVERVISMNTVIDTKRDDSSVGKVSLESDLLNLKRGFDVKMDVVHENVNEFGEADVLTEEAIVKDDDNSNISSKSSDDSNNKPSSADTSSNSADDNSNASSEHLSKPISPIEDSITASNNSIQNVAIRSVQDKFSDNSQTAESNHSFSNEREIAVTYSNEDVHATKITRPFENIGGKFISSFTSVDTFVPKNATSDVSQSSQSVDSNEIVKRRMLVFPDPTKEIIQSPVKKPKYIGKELPSSESEAELEHKRRVVEELDRLKKEFEEFRQQKLKSNDSERQAAAEELKRQFDMVESYTLSTKLTPVVAEQKKVEVQPPMTDIRPIPTVTGVSASGGSTGSREEGLLQGEIKWDWRPSNNTGSSALGNRRPRPSRWGVVPKDQIQTNSTLIEVPIKSDEAFNCQTAIPSILDVSNDHNAQHRRRNHEHVDMMSDQEMLQMQAHYEASYNTHDDGNTIYKIPTISSTEVRDRVTRSDHEAKYEMYSEAQEMGYVTIMPDAETSEEERKAKKISLDERINLVLQFPGAGGPPGGAVGAGLGPVEEPEPPPSPPQLPPSLALRAPPPIHSKGILVLGSVKITRIDPRAPPKCKKVCFSDGLAPGMDSDLEEDLQPPTKRAKSTKKAKRKCGGHSYPCPPHWPDYHPHYDSLPPPPPPPGSPPLSLGDTRSALTTSTVMNAPDAIITRLPRIPSHNETQLIT